jgi:hypothetical protein
MEARTRVPLLTQAVILQCQILLEQAGAAIPLTIQELFVKTPHPA